MRFSSLFFVASTLAWSFGCASDPEPDTTVETPDAGPSASSEPGVERDWECIHPGGAAPDYLHEVGCLDDFLALASRPIDASIPGARSLKTSVDRDAESTLSFQNSVKYPIHWDFVSEHRSVAAGLPRVPTLSEFNQVEYYLPQRRFLLGALTHYEGPDLWVYEISPYDTSDVEMITQTFQLLREHTYLGEEIAFHPTSESVAAVARELPEDIRIVTTDKLFEGIDYQPLNPAAAIGKLRFITALELETSYVGFRDIVVLDRVPNDISVTQGIITQEFQTPLAHINVLSQNRGTPNMGLRGAYENAELRALEGKWVRLEVGLTEWQVEEVSEADADAWWDANKPSEVQVPGMDLSVTELVDIDDTIEKDPADLRAAVKAGTRAVGGKAANYAALARIEGVPVPKAFAVPIYFYKQFMEENAFDLRVAEMLENEEFIEDAATRDRMLKELRDDMKEAPVNADFEQMLVNKLNTDYPGVRMRFRSSTNAEDLDGFTGAGLYTSKSGELADPTSPVLDAVREVWASVWFFRAFEERSFRSIDHLAVGMALLVHNSFPTEEANGVALTGNPFDKTGAEPAFYVNVQRGGESVVLPPAGTTTDEFLLFFDSPGQPVTYLSHSNLVAEGTVLTPAQINELGAALAKIRDGFARAYAQSPWWAMDVEFKFDAEGDEVPPLFVKQARPFGNR